MWRVVRKISVAILPIPVHIALGRFRGHLFSFLAPPSAAVRKNIETVFRDRDTVEVKAISRDYVAFKKQVYLWRILPRHPGFKSSRRVSVVGLEHLEGAKREKRGVILVTAHLGYPHIIPRVLESLGYSVRQLVAELDRIEANEDKERWWRALRPIERRVYSKTRVLTDILGPFDFVASLDIRPIVSALNDREILMIAGDGLKGTQFITLPLLGKPYPFPTGFIKIALMTQAVVMPAFALPVSRPAGIQVQIHNPLKINPDHDLQTNAQEFALALDSQLRRTPHLWTRWRIPDWFEEARDRAKQVAF